MGWFKKKAQAQQHFGTFGTGYRDLPTPGISFDEMAAAISSQPSIYMYREADVFSPGTQNWPLQVPHDTPLATMWGHGFLTQRGNTWPVEQPPQIYVPLISVPQSALNGIIVAGLQIEQQPTAIGGGRPVDESGGFLGAG
jgi:hypothetical protein